MYEETFKDFKLERQVDKELMDKYKELLPIDIINIWKKFGYGSFKNGYLKLINPDDFIEVLKLCYFAAEKSIPIMVTAFGDIITWEEGCYMMLINVKERDIRCLAKGMKYIWGNLNDDYFVNKYFELKQYEKAVAKHGELAYDECFGYTPLLGMGGSKKIANLKKVKIREHIELITAMLGRIE